MSLTNLAMDLLTLEKKVGKILDDYGEYTSEFISQIKGFIGSNGNTKHITDSLTAYDRKFNELDWQIEELWKSVKSLPRQNPESVNLQELQYKFVSKESYQPIIDELISNNKDNLEAIYQIKDDFAMINESVKRLQYDLTNNRVISQVQDTVRKVTSSVSEINDSIQSIHAKLPEYDYKMNTIQIERNKQIEGMKKLFSAVDSNLHTIHVQLNAELHKNQEEMHEQIQHLHNAIGYESHKAITYEPPRVQDLTDINDTVSQQVDQKMGKFRNELMELHKNYEQVITSIKETEEYIDQENTLLRNDLYETIQVKIEESKSNDTSQESLAIFDRRIEQITDLITRLQTKFDEHDTRISEIETILKRFNISTIVKNIESLRNMIETIDHSPKNVNIYRNFTQWVNYNITNPDALLCAQAIVEASQEPFYNELAISNVWYIYTILNDTHSLFQDILFQKMLSITKAYMSANFKFHQASYQQQLKMLRLYLQHGVNYYQYHNREHNFSIISVLHIDPNMLFSTGRTILTALDDDIYDIFVDETFNEHVMIQPMPRVDKDAIMQFCNINNISTPDSYIIIYIQVLLNRVGYFKINIPIDDIRMLSQKYPHIYASCGSIIESWYIMCQDVPTDQLVEAGLIIPL
jgi:hypothetical protein